MNILLTCHYTLPHYGGVEVVVEQLAKRFVRRGHRVRIISCRTSEPAYEQRDGFEIIRVKAWNTLEQFGVPYPLFHPQLLPVLVQMVGWADVVHGHGYLYQSTVTALLLAKAMRRPTVLTEYAGFVQYRQTLWNALQMVAVHSLGKLSLTLSDAIIVIGIRAQGLIRSLVGQNKRIHLIPSAVDTELFFPLTEASKKRLRQQLGWDERPKVLFVGRFTARKCIDLLLQAADMRYDLVLCGRGELPITTSKSNVLIYSSVEQQKLVQIYQASDLFVNPSHSEGGFPLTAQEAMACGLPVIAVFDPIYLTYVTDKVVRFVESSPEALRDAILALLNDPTERERRSRLSVEWARTHFNWEHRVAQHLALYEQLLAERRR